MRNIIRTISLVLLLSAAATFGVAQVYSITDLGPMVEPTSINTWGQVVGNYNGHAFIWTRTGGLKDIGILNGGTFSRATAINDLGAVAGTADGPGTVVSTDPESPSVDCSNLIQPFVWTRNNGMKGLGTVPFAYGFPWPLIWCDAPYFASGINEAGNVIGYNGIPGTSYQHGFLWTGATGMSLVIGSYPPSFANGISNTGQVVGQESPHFIKAHAVTWTGGVTKDLGTLGGVDPDFHLSSSAMGVNDLGQVVGFSSVAEWTSEPVHAVLWDRNGNIRDLGTLPGHTDSLASKINFFGQVIGSSGNSIVGQHDGEPDHLVVARPFIWSEPSGMRDLNTLLRNNSWRLNSATDINVWGQIVGVGTRNGVTHGYLLTPKVLFQY
jgi:probable HAF family extracellular repeat protein